MSIPNEINFECFLLQVELCKILCFFLEYKYLRQLLVDLDISNQLERVEFREGGYPFKRIQAITSNLYTNINHV